MGLGGLAGIEWSAIPLTRRKSVSQQLSERINLELVTDGYISQESWQAYKSGGERTSHIITAEDLDGYYRGETGLPPRAAKYADEAAKQNNIYLPHRDPRDGILKVLISLAVLFMLIGTIEVFTPIAFFHAYPQYEVTLQFFSAGVLLIAVMVMLEVMGGNRR